MNRYVFVSFPIFSNSILYRCTWLFVKFVFNVFPQNYIQDWIEVRRFEKELRKIKYTKVPQLHVYVPIEGVAKWGVYYIHFFQFEFLCRLKTHCSIVHRRSTKIHSMGSSSRSVYCVYLTCRDILLAPHTSILIACQLIVVNLRVR